MHGGACDCKTDAQQARSTGKAYLEPELMIFLSVSQATDIGIKEGVLSENIVCSLHTSERSAEVSDIDSRMPAIKQLCEVLQAAPCT